MPLDKSGSAQSVGTNVKRLKKEGVKSKQAIAIALNTEREYAKGSRKSKLEATYDKYVKEKD
jgi:hypothetical protein